MGDLVNNTELRSGRRRAGDRAGPPRRHVYRDRMKKPVYSEPMIGWNEDDFHAGVTKFGVSHYEGTAKLKIATPTRPALLPPPPSTEPEVEAHGYSMLM